MLYNFFVSHLNFINLHVRVLFKIQASDVIFQIRLNSYFVIKFSFKIKNQ